METKKLLPVIGLLFAVVIVPAALAQDTLISPAATADQVTTADENDLGVFDVPLGAQYRFLQLQRAITRNVLIGTDVVEVLETNYPGTDFTELHVILEEMESLLDEVKAYDFSGKELNVIARDYVAFRKSSVELTQEFRELARGNITSDDRQQIRERIANVSDSLSGLNNQIRDSRREMNAYRVRVMLQKMNATDEQLLEKIRNGQATKSDVWNGVSTAFRALPVQAKVQAVKEVVSDAVKRAAVKSSIVGNVSETLPQRVREMSDERLQQKAEIRTAVRKASDLIERKNRLLNITASQVTAQRMKEVSSQFEWVNQESGR